MNASIDTAPQPGLGATERVRVVLAVDPGERSGLAAMALGAAVPGLVRELDRAKFSEESAAELLDATLWSYGPNVEWFAVLERPFNPRGPVAAVSMWRRVFVALARRRADTSGARYRVPLVLDPRPAEWRSGLGLQHPRAGREACKANAIVWLKRTTGIEATADAAEAACLAMWGERIARVTGAWHHRRRPKVSKKGVLRPAKPPVEIKFVP